MKMFHMVVKKVRLIQIVKRAYQLKWFKIPKFRRKYYFELYCGNNYNDLHSCLYDLTGESIYNDKGRCWYINSWDKRFNKDGIGYDIKKAKQQNKLNRKWTVK